MKTVRSKDGTVIAYDQTGDRVLEGQTHDVAAEPLAPLLIEFFKDEIRK